MDSLTLLRGENCVTQLVQESIEIEPLTFFICLDNQLISMGSIFTY